MRTGPFMHIPGHLPAANVQLLKDGRLAPGGVMDISDPRLPNLNDMGKSISIWKLFIENVLVCPLSL